MKSIFITRYLTIQSICKKYLYLQLKLNGKQLLSVLRLVGTLPDCLLKVYYLVALTPLQLGTYGFHHLICNSTFYIFYTLYTQPKLLGWYIVELLRSKNLKKVEIIVRRQQIYPRHYKIRWNHHQIYRQIEHFLPGNNCFQEGEL